MVTVRGCEHVRSYAVRGCAVPVIGNGGVSRQLPTYGLRIQCVRILAFTLLVAYRYINAGNNQEAIDAAITVLDAEDATKHFKI